MIAGGRRAVVTATAGAVTLLIASLAGADFQPAFAAYRRSDYAAALREWLPVADAGNTTAQLYCLRIDVRARARRARSTSSRRVDGTSAPPPRGTRRSVGRHAAGGAERVTRAIAAAPVDAALLGKWRTATPDPAGAVVELVWDIAPSGDFAMSFSRRPPDGSVLGRSQDAVSSRRKTAAGPTRSRRRRSRGTYRVIGADAFEATGPLGTARWVRVGGTPGSPPRPPAATASPTPDARVLMEDDFRQPPWW